MTTLYRSDQMDKRFRLKYKTDAYRVAGVTLADFREKGENESDADYNSAARNEVLFAISGQLGITLDDQQLTDLLSDL